MFGGLTRTLDRDFLIGYYLPALLFVSGTGFFLGYHDALPATTATAADVWEFTVDNPVVAAGVAAVVTWMIAASLLAFNGWIIRFMEGYIGRAFLKPFTKRRRRELRELRHRADHAEKAVRECWARGQHASPDDEDDWADATKALATSFPGHEKWVLPFKFGNTVRAFEAYPYATYGVDPTAGWARLLAVIPEDYRALVHNSKVQVDFIVNLWVVWWLLLFQYVGFAVYAGALDPLWVPIAAVASILSLTRLARGAAVGWGAMVKSAFDVYLPELARRLGHDPQGREADREFWSEMNKRWHYGDRATGDRTEPDATEETEQVNDLSERRRAPAPQLETERIEVRVTELRRRPRARR